MQIQTQGEREVRMNIHKGLFKHLFRQIQEK